MEGTFASFGKLLAIQGKQLMSQLVYGNNFTNVEINMRFVTDLHMTGAIVFTANGGLKTCRSDLTRRAGLFVLIIDTFVMFFKMLTLKYKYINLYFFENYGSEKYNKKTSCVYKKYISNICFKQGSA